MKARPAGGNTGIFGSGRDGVFRMRRGPEKEPAGGPHAIVPDRFSFTIMAVIFRVALAVEVLPLRLRPPELLSALLPNGSHTGPACCEDVGR